MPPPIPEPYRPCRCGVLVLHGHTRDGIVVVVDPAQRTFVAIWEPEPKPKGTPAHYVFVQSAGYPVHVCAGSTTSRKDKSHA
jgi:hypothetical protein